MAADASKLRILVVDDEPSVGNTVKMLLKFDGHEVESTNSSEEALGMFKSGRFDLVFTDFTMPGMNGNQLAAAIKAGAPDQPVVMITAYGGTFPVTRCGFRRRPNLSGWNICGRPSPESAAKQAAPLGQS